jgi:hypothetical protein
MHFSQDIPTHTETDEQYMWAGSILFTLVNGRHHQHQIRKFE